MRWLPLAKFWYNTSYHLAIGVTPFEALYGRPPPTILTYVPGTASIQEVEGWLRRRDLMLTELKPHLPKAQERMKRLADKRREREFAN